MKFAEFYLFDIDKCIYFKKYVAYLFLIKLKNGEEQLALAHHSLTTYICKHIIGMSNRLKYCKPPPEAKSLNIVEKNEKEADNLRQKGFIDTMVWFLRTSLFLPIKI